LLASTSKVGRLRVEGPDRDGTLWVDGPMITGAVCGDRLGPVEVLVALLRLEEGAFRFDPGEAPPGPRLSHPIDDALAEATAYLAEWLAIEAILPSPDHVVRLQSELRAPEVTISASAWRGIAAIGGGGAVRDLIPRFGVTDLEGSRALAGLVETGLLEVLAPGARVPDKAEAVVDLEPPSPVFSAPADEVIAAAPAEDEPDALSNGQPWRDQVRQLLGTAPEEPVPAAELGERFGPASRTPAVEPPAPVVAPPSASAPPAADGDRDVLLKFLSSVQP
jgi:hypothetical protein